MGLSSSKTKTTSNTSQNTNQAESGTTTPVAPDWLTQAAQDYVGRIGAFGDMDPNGFVAPAAPLQQMAWQNAGSLGDWRGQAATAAQLVLGAGQSGANYAGARGANYAGASGANYAGARGADYAGTGGGKAVPQHSSNLPRPADGQASAFSGASAAQPGPAWQANAAGYEAPQLGQASLVSGQGYAAPRLGAAQGYAAARVGQPIGAQNQVYGATAADAATIAPVTNAAASNADAASLLTNLNAYQNPWQDQVVDATMADYDQNAARQRAALEARGAAAGAFGGSRFGIAQGQFEGDLARGRATLESGLLGQGFNNAAALSQSDAANRQQAALLNAQNRTGVDLANAGAANARDLAAAGFGQQANLFNADAVNAAARRNVDAFGQTSQFNAGQANQFALAQAGMDNEAGQYGAEAGNRFALAQGQFDADAGQFGAAAANAASLANAGARNQFALGQADLAQAAGQFNAGARNQANLYNAGANNQMSQFNAGQADAAANRALQAAGMLGGLANDYGGGTRADLAAMAQLGDQQRAIEQAYAMAGPAQLQLMGQLSGMTPYDILVGRQVNGNTTGTMTGTGTSTATQTPSMFDSLLKAASAAAAFIPSDPRLKRGVEKIGELASGLGLYLYNYLWDDALRKPRVGVMANEVGRIAPEALGPRLHGFMTVDYARLGLAHLVEA